MIVVDASAIIEVLLNTPTGSILRRHFLAAGETLHAPQPDGCGGAAGVARYSMTKVLSAEQGSEALHDYVAMPLTRYPHSVLLSRVRELRPNLTA